MKRLVASAYTLVLVALSAGGAYSQLLRGNVVDDEQQPLPSVTIYLPDLERGTITDESGFYELAGLPPGTHTVRFSFVGFVTTEHAVLIGSESVELNVTLVPTDFELAEILAVAEGRGAALNRAALSVSQLEPRDISQGRGQSLAETLSHLAGVVSMTTGPSIAKPVIRGLHSQRVLVLNAGVPQEGQQWGGEHAPEIDPFAPVRIEVVRGAAGVEYGVGAIGGVIRLEPEDLPVSPKVSGSVALNGFSNNRQAAGSALVERGVRAVPGMGWRLQGSFRKAGAARTPEFVVGNSAFTQLNGSASVAYHRERFALHSYFSRFSSELGLYKGAHIGNNDDLLRAIERGRPNVRYEFVYDIEAPKQTVRHNLLSLTGYYDLSSGDRIEVKAGLQRNNRQEFDAHRRFSEPVDDPDPAFDLTLSTQTVDAKLRTLPRGSFFGVFGISGMNQGNVNAKTGYLIPNFRALTGGTYARGTWVRGPWTLETGLRLDHRWMKAYPQEGRNGDFARRTHNYTSLSGVVGAIWQFAPSWSIATNWGTAWRPPGVNELYNFGVHHGTAQFEIGNSSLGGERSYNVDLTLRHEGDRSRMEASVFNNGMNGYIYLLPEGAPRVTIRGTFPSFRYAQTDAVLRGADGQAELDVLDRLQLHVHGSVVRGTDRRAGLPLIFMPADRFSVGAGLSLPDLGLVQASEIELESTVVRRQTRYPEGIDYADPPDGYTLFSVGYQAELLLGSSTLQLGLTVRNLLDTTYRDYLSRFRYFIDDPGRNVVLRLRLPIG